MGFSTHKPKEVISPVLNIFFDEYTLCFHQIQNFQSTTLFSSRGLKKGKLT